MAAPVCLPSSFLTPVGVHMDVSFQFHSPPKQKNPQNRRTNPTGICLLRVFSKWCCLPQPWAEVSPAGSQESFSKLFTGTRPVSPSSTTKTPPNTNPAQCDFPMFSSSSPGGLKELIALYMTPRSLQSYHLLTYTAPNAF